MNESAIAADISKDFKASYAEAADLQFLRAGGSGYVFKLTLQSGEIRALKVFRPDQIGEKALLDGFVEEGVRLCQIRHPRIIEAFEASQQLFPSQAMELPFYIMEYFPHESLDKIIDQGILPEKVPIIVSLLRQVAEGLYYLHSLSSPICHLDVKEANLLVDMTDPEQPNIKLSDFGVSKSVSRDQSTTEVRGSLFYWPREWQQKLRDRVPTNNNRARIRLPRNEIPITVDLHMLGVTFGQVIGRLRSLDRTSFSYRSLMLMLTKMNWDELKSTTREEKYTSAASILRDLSQIDRSRSLPPPLDDEGAIRVPVNYLPSFSRPTRTLLDSPWIQRLRRVRQLGVAHLVYPGATHTRFEHAIGSYALAVRYLKALFSNRNSPWFSVHFSDEETKALAISVFLHDLGHYPFAHQLEDLDQWDRHELLSYRILSGDICAEFPDLEAEFGSPQLLLDTIREGWGVDPDLILKMFAFCYRADLPAHLIPKHVPRAWRVAGELLNGPIDVDKVDYLARDSQHCGVPFSLPSDQTRFLSALTVAIDDGDVHLAVTEKGRVDAELVPVIRYAMFSEVYWHHTVRSFTSMVRRAVYLASQNEALNVGNFLKWSDDRLFRELRNRAAVSENRALSELVSCVWNRRPYVRLFTLSLDRDRELYHTLTSRGTELMKGLSWEDDLSMVQSVFKLGKLEPHHLLWDIPKPGKDQMSDLRIVNADGAIIATNPGPLWASLSDNFERWVRKIRLFVHPSFRLERLSTGELTERNDRLRSALRQRFRL